MPRAYGMFDYYHQIMSLSLKCYQNDITIIHPYRGNQYEVKNQSHDFKTSELANTIDQNYQYKLK